MAANYGAHEIMEFHEVLTDTIDGINQFQLYRPHCQDSELLSILDHQLQFMMNEYNTLVNMMNQTGATTMGSYKTIDNFTPMYGLRQPAPESPNTSMNQMNDRDVASGMMGCHKASAGLRMHAALECANPTLRNALLQAARNCADQAYEVWTYMNRKGYYQVPTLQQNTTQTIMNTYQPAQAMTMAQTTQMQ